MLRRHVGVALDRAGYTRSGSAGATPSCSARAPNRPLEFRLLASHVPVRARTPPALCLARPGRSRLFRPWRTSFARSSNCFAPLHVCKGWWSILGVELHSVERSKKAPLVLLPHAHKCELWHARVLAVGLGHATITEVAESFDLWFQSHVANKQFLHELQRERPMRLLPRNAGPPLDLLSLRRSCSCTETASFSVWGASSKSSSASRRGCSPPRRGFRACPGVIPTFFSLL